MEIQRFHREMNTSEQQLAPLFTFYPVLDMPEGCRMLRMNVGYNHAHTYSDAGRKMTAMLTFLHPATAVPNKLDLAPTEELALAPLVD